ncbi:MAG TPA: hypothetical protein PLD25_11450 [Chloroflexota bacterium]|nr:hypothetical protein [Chloroflexota bacterium]
MPPYAAAVPYLSRYASIRLFQERARAVMPDFRLTAENVTDVAQICAWLDGLPLAIEMAAAQVKWLTPAQVFAQLRARLMALTGGPRDLTPRQQSLSGAIAWSYHLLTPAERVLFGVLGVFVDGCEVTAVQAVLTRMEIPDWRLADNQSLALNLQSLVEKSLLYRLSELNHTPRYAMLQTLREYAQEQLQVQGLLAAALAGIGAFVKPGRRRTSCLYPEPHWSVCQVARRSGGRAEVQRTGAGHPGKIRR